MEWRLEVLRPLPRITSGGEEIALGERGGISLAVALYLILTRDRESQRQDLVELFRGMSGGGLDRERLRRIVHTLRQTFGASAISATKGGLQWQLPIQTDVDELLAMTPDRMDDPELPLYFGDFLSGWEKEGHAGRFGAWIKERREEYRAQAFHLIDTRARLSRDEAKWDEMRRAGARMSALWPAREEGYLWEVLALEGAGDLVRAEARFQEASAAIGRTGKVSDALAMLGERLRKRREAEIAQRAAEPAVAAHLPDSKGPVEGSGTEPIVTDGGTDELMVGEPKALSPALDATAWDVPSGGPMNEHTHALGGPPPDSAPPPRSGISAVKRGLAVGALCLALVAAWLAGGTAGQASDPPLCREGRGRATLVREVYQTGRGVDAGSSFRKVWTLENDGSCRWDREFRVVRQPADSQGVPRLVVPAETLRLERQVLPGDSASIAIPMRAPVVHAHVRERWSLLDASGSSVTIDGSPYLPVDLLVRRRPVAFCRPEEMEAAIVSTSHRERQVLAAGTEFEGTWTLINPRLCAWRPEVALERTGERPPALSGPTNRVMAGDTVLPGEAVTFRVPMYAPALPSPYAEEWELVAPGGTRVPMSDLASVRISVRVASPGEAAQLTAPLCGRGEAEAGFVSETLRDSTPLAPDRSFEKVWTLRNTGDCRWDGSMALHFTSSTGNRMSLVDEVPVVGMVMPEHTYSFVIPGRSPVQSGVYTEKWQLRTRYGEVVPIPNPNAVWVTIRVR
jgi:DNA-binding SARP family transcriptional activator